MMGAPSDGCRATLLSEHAGRGAVAARTGRWYLDDEEQCKVMSVWERLMGWWR